MANSLGRICVGRGIAAPPGSLVRYHADFLRTVLRNPNRIDRRNNPSGGHELYRGGAGSESVAHGPQQVICAVHHFAHVAAMEASSVVRGPDIAVASCLA